MYSEYAGCSTVNITNKHRRQLISLESLVIGHVVVPVSQLVSDAGEDVGKQQRASEDQSRAEPVTQCE